MFFWFVARVVVLLVASALFAYAMMAKPSSL
jgi:hypothetical protein